MAIPSPEAIAASLRGKPVKKAPIVNLPKPNIPTTQEIMGVAKPAPVDFSRLRVQSAQPLGGKTFADFSAAAPEQVKEGLNRIKLYDTEGRIVPKEPIVTPKTMPGSSVAVAGTREKEQSIFAPLDVLDKAFGEATLAPSVAIAEGLKRIPWTSEFGQRMAQNIKSEDIEGYFHKLGLGIPESTGLEGKPLSAAKGVGLVAGLIGDPTNLIGGPKKGIVRAVQLAQRSENAVPEIFKVLKRVGIEDSLAQEYATKFATADFKSIEEGVSALKAMKPKSVAVPKTADEAAQSYWDDVIKPNIEQKKPVVLSGDDMKARFGKDYAPEKSDMYAKANYQNVQRALKEAPGDFVMLGGGPGSGKTEFLTNDIISKGFDGVLYDTTLSNFKGAKRVIEDARSAGKGVHVYGIVPNLEKAYDFTNARKAATGRDVPLEVFANRHAGFLETIKKLVQDGVLKPEEVSLFDMRNAANKDEVKQLVRMNISTKDPMALLSKVSYNEQEIISRLKDRSYAKETNTTGDGGVNALSRNNGEARGSSGGIRPDPRRELEELDARAEAGVGEEVAPPVRTNLIRALSKEKTVGPIKDLLSASFPRLTDVTKTAFSKRISALTRESDIAGLLAAMQRLENQADAAGQQVLDSTLPPSVRDILTRKNAEEDISLLTRGLEATDKDGKKILAAAQNEYDMLWESLDQKVVDRFNEANIERGILDDIIADHPAKALLKFRRPGQAYEDFRLDEALVRGMKQREKLAKENPDLFMRQKAEGTGSQAAAELDQMVTELGYKDLDDAQKGLEDYLSMREQLSMVKEEIKELKPRVQASQVVRGVLEGLPIIPTKEATEIDNLINSATVREFRDIRRPFGQFRDVDRNFESFFGNLYPEMKRLFLDPLDDAKKKFVDGKDAVRAKLEQNVTKRYGFKRLSDEDKAIMDYGEVRNGADAGPDVEYKTKEDLVARFGEEKAAEIMESADWFRNQYEVGIREANNVLRKIYPNDPSKLIAYRKDYFRHYQEFGGGFIDAIRNFMDVPAGIDPKLVGISENTKPKSKFLSFAQSRLGFGSTRSAIGGYLDYMEALEYLKNIDPEIGKFRYLRRKIAEVAPRAGTSEENRVLEGADHFLSFLDGFANDLAGKTSAADRFIQDNIPGGRGTLKVINFFNNRIKANTMLGNLGTSLAQLANVPAAISQTKQHSVTGFARTVASLFDTQAASSKSTFLKERFQDSFRSQFPVSFKKQPVKRSTEEVAQILAWTLKTGDEVGTRFAWNSFYEKYLAENVRKADGSEIWKSGSSEQEAVRYADQQTRRLVGGRGVGEMPLIQKAQTMQLLAPFTLEVNNALYWLSDRVKNRELSSIAAFFILNYLYNEGTERARGSRVSYDPINALIEGSETFAREARAGHPVRGAVEFAGRQAGEALSNVSGGQLITNVIPDEAFGMKKKDLFGQGDPNRFGSPVLLAGALSDPLTKLLLPFGGNQLKKTYTGVQALMDEQMTSRSGKTNFPIARTPANVTRAVAFGPYATSEARDSFKTGDDLHGLISIQDRDRENLASDAEKKWKELQKIRDTKGADAATAEWNAIKAQNPELLKKIKDISNDEKLGLTANDRLVKMLGVQNGARARYIFDQFESLKTKEEKEALWKEYRRKKIISDEVKKQLEELLKS